MQLEGGLQRLSGILSVSANTFTGNVLVLYQDRLTPKSIADEIIRIHKNFLDVGSDYPARGVDERQDSEGAMGCSGEDWLDTRPTTDSVSAPPLETPVSWHSMGKEQVLRLLETNFKTGLSDVEASRRQAEHGMNMLPGTFSRSFLHILKSQALSWPVALVGAAAGISLLTGGVLEGVLAVGVALVNLGIGVFTEDRAEKTLGIVRKEVALKTSVLRDNRVREVPFHELVVGDVIELQAGSRVPADARVIRSDRLTVDEAALTGESVPVSKSTGRSADGKSPISERRNMVYRGTLVVEGSGYAVVVSTGKDTVLGKLQSFLGDVFPPEALMARDMRKTAVHLLQLGLGACGVFAAISLVRGYSVVRIVRESFLLIAEAFPSGLSTIALSAFALRHHDLRRNGILVHRLRALGSLASVKVVCFDKTGTLTMNRMTVTELSAGGKCVQVGGTDGLHTGRSSIHPFEDPDIYWLIKLSALCNEAALIDETDQPSVEGSSTELSLLRLAENVGIDVHALRHDHPTTRITPRTEKRVFMLTVHRWDEKRRLTAMKGSPLEVLARCSHYLKEGEILALEDEDRSRVEDENYRMAGTGFRVLGVAFRQGPFHTGRKRVGMPVRLIWVGLIALADPIRKGAASLVEALHRAGVRTAVITGDQGLTARHIGEELRLSGDEPLRILDASDFRTLSAPALRNVVTQAHVFARLSPTQKLQVIQAYQASGLSVVMVGDGFNDVLALKVADVGIAMGKSGADLARESADLVLEEDEIESVMVAINNGRAFYQNVRRSVRFLLASSDTDLVLAFSERSGLLSQGPSVWKSVWSNLECLGLALEGPPSRPLDLQPRDEHPSLLTRQDREDAFLDALDILAGASGPGLYGLLQYGPGPKAAGLFLQSAAINEMLYGLACRERDGLDPRETPPGTMLQALIAGSVGVQLLAAVFPGLGKPFGEMILHLLDAAVLAAGGLISQTLFKRPSNPVPG
jgi:Ca2+-transporting ATPase